MLKSQILHDHCLHPKPIKIRVLLKNIHKYFIHRNATEKDVVTLSQNASIFKIRMSRQNLLKLKLNYKYIIGPIVCQKYRSTIYISHVFYLYC
jgi:hypothetical protein